MTRSIWTGALLCLVNFFQVLENRAAEREFVLQGATLMLEERSEAEVYFRSMRYNRAREAWNVEVSVTNSGADVWKGPLVLVVENFSGLTRLEGVDGIDGTSPGHEFFDLSNWMPKPEMTAGEATFPRTLTLGGVESERPELEVKVFSASAPTLLGMGISRSLDETGRPLDGVVVEEAGPAGGTELLVQSDSGLVSLGQGGGRHFWKFSKPGHLPVWRDAELVPGKVEEIVTPRLAGRSLHPVAISPLNGGRISGGGVEIRFEAGVFSGPSQSFLTPLTAQTLPALLPMGWSPLQAFWLETELEPSGPGQAEAKLWGPIQPEDTVLLVRWDEVSLQWVAVENLGGNSGETVEFNLFFSGAIAVVVADQSPLPLPPLPELGEGLMASVGGTAIDVNLSADGQVNPSVSPASERPEEVTAMGRVKIWSEGEPLSSGLALRSHVTETYNLRDGTNRRPPPYGNYIIGYQRPGDRSASTLETEFPLRPQLLLSGETLEEALMVVEVFRPEPFAGEVLDSRGGQIAADGIRLLAGRGVLERPQVVTLRGVDVADFESLEHEGFEWVAGFELAVGGVVSGQRLSLQVEGLSPGSLYVLGRVLSESGLFGLEPMERFETDAQGRLVSLEPAQGERLPGVVMGGEYLLAKVNEKHGLVTGIARDSTGAPAAGLLVSLEDSPWLTQSGADGQYRLVAPVGERMVTVRDLLSGDVRQVAVEVVDPEIVVEHDLQILAVGPSVVDLHPLHESKNVPRVTSVEVTFSEPIQAGGWTEGGMQLFNEEEVPVQAEVTLNLARTKATLLPRNPLAADTRYTLRLSAAITDLEGNGLEGETEFHFTTASDVLDRVGAQLVIYEPGATNVPPQVLAQIPAYDPEQDNSNIVVHGSAGTADPEVPVVLVNESTGATSTVLSKPDGSFFGLIQAAEADFVSGTFVNRNGTRTYIPVSKQLFDNGFVGLYRGGGILEAESEGGEVQVLVEPGSIPSKTKFKLEPLTRQQVRELVGDTEPQTAKLVGPGVVVTKEGDDPALPSDLSIPVEPSELALPEGLAPEEGVYGLCAVTEVDGVKAYHLIDDMEYEDGKLVTRSFPFVAFAIEAVFTLWDTAAIVNSVPPSPGQPEPPRIPEPPNPALSLQKISLVCIQYPISRKVRVQGKVFACDLNDPSDCNSEARPGLPGALVTLRHFTQSLQGLKGRLESGSIYSVTDKRGRYVLIADNPTLLDPIGKVEDDEGALIATATHGRFFGQRPATVVDLSATSPVAFADLAFGFGGTVGENNAPPFISGAHTPAAPAPGEEVLLSVLATHGSQVPAIQAPVPFHVVPLVPGLQVGLSDVQITGPLQTQEAGAFGKRETFRIESDQSVQVVLKLEAAVEGGQPRIMHYPLSFGGSQGGGTNEVLQVDYNDQVGPVVMQTWPPDRARGVAPGEPVRIQFNEPIDQSIETLTNAVQFSPAIAGSQRILSEDQRELSVYAFDLLPDKDYTLTLNSSVLDLAGNALDQDPSTIFNESFTLAFRTAPVVKGQFPNLGSGGGVVTKGIHAFALDRQGGGSLVAYDLSDPESPTEIGRSSVPGYPRDLALIPDYSFVKKPDTPVLTRDLVAVVGGDVAPLLDESGNVVFAGQFLWVFDVSHPASPERIASKLITRVPAAVVNKIVWEPPIMAYLEFGITCSEETLPFATQCVPVQQIGLVNLQSFIIGSHLTQQEFIDLPRDPTPGVDLNNDGDYVDEGETLPLPGSVPFEFAGKVDAVVLQDSIQRIFDFSFNTSSGHLSVVLEEGKEVDVDGFITSNVLKPAYRTLISGGSLLDLSSREAASFEFPGMRPKRVATLFGVSLTLNDTNRTVDLAFVSLVPDQVHTNQVAVLDITDPLGPNLLTHIPVDPELGFVQSVTQREDGALRLATSHHILLLDPARLGHPWNPGEPHPALIGMIPDAGSGNHTLEGNLAGMNLVGLGGKNQLVLSAPWMRFVSVLNVTNVVEPQELVDHSTNLLQTFEKIQVTDHLIPARYRTVTNVVESTLDPAKPQGHYYVLVSMPGSAGTTIELGLESLNRAGHPLVNKGLGFPPVRALSSNAVNQIEQSPRADCDAPMASLTAYRLSSDKTDTFYNFYLSKPFALVYEGIKETELDTLKSSLDREIIWSGHYLRAIIDPEMEENPVAGPFAAEADSVEKVLRPGVSVMARSLPGDYLMGPNPPPTGGHAEVPGAFGAVSAHNGEFRTDTIDIALPGRRMPIVFKRTIAGQDLYDGPFGRGWDFVYNQRLVELDTALVPPGYKVPLVIRGNEQDEVGESKDVLFCTGEGRTLIFQYEGEEPPADYLDDPLMKDLDWLDNAIAFYMPPEGVFDALVRFPDGQFARLTPNGTQYWYNRLGRLEVIYDRYPKNELRFQYNERDELVRIIDRSVAVTRHLKLGYYRLNGDSLFVSDLDETTDNRYLAGKVARLKDYTDRDILFYYDECGQMERREGPEVTMAHEGGFTDRPITYYTYKVQTSQETPANSIRGITAGSENGTPLFMAEFDALTTASPVVKSGNGYGGSIIVDVEHENTAATVAQGDAKTTVTGADGATTELRFDEGGRPKEVTLSGYEAGEAKTTFSYTNGLIHKVTFPSGEAIEYRYDFGNDVLRSRGNLVGVARTPGPEGGENIPEATYQYDSYYNLSSGPHKDFNGNTITYELTNTGQDIKSITYTGAGSETFSYNEYGQLEEHVTVEGTVYGYRYDGSTGFMSEEILGANTTTFEYIGKEGRRGLPTQLNLPRGAPIAITYDERDQTITVRRGSAKTEYSYDQNGNRVRIASQVGSQQPLIISRSYEPNGFLTTNRVHQIETEGSQQDLVTVFIPDSVYRIKEIHYPAGAIQKFEDFDHLGRYKKMSLGDYVEEYTYDLRGNLKTVTRGDAVEEYTYDGYGRLTETKLPVENGEEEIHRSYYGNDQLKEISFHNAEGGVDKQLKYGIDSYGRTTLVQAVTEEGTADTTFKYDGTARTLTITDPVSMDTVITFDGAGRVMSKSNLLQRLTCSLDGNGNVEEATSLEGIHTYTYQFTPYDDLDHSTRFADDLGTVMTFGRRLDGEVSSIRDAKNQETKLPRSKLGEVLQRIKPNGIEFHYEYNRRRNVASILDRQNAGRTYSYDSTLRLESQSYRDGSSSTHSDFDARHRKPRTIQIPAGNVLLEYDAKGRILERTFQYAGDVRYEQYQYDALDRVTFASYPGGESTYDFYQLGPLQKATHRAKEIDYALDFTIREDGERVGLTYPSPGEVTVTETRDPAGRLGGVLLSQGDPVVVLTGYEAGKAVGSRTLGNTVLLEENFYDQRKRLLRRRYTRLADERIVSDVRYAYDATDNIVARQFIHRAGRTDFFQFDSGHRLLRADFGVRPAIEFSSTRNFPGFQTPEEISGSWEPGLFAREYRYDTQGLDTFINGLLINPDDLFTPYFATNYGLPDNFLNIQSIDGVDRLSDNLGNPKRELLLVRAMGTGDAVPVPANLRFNGQSHLIGIERDDGVSITYDYQHNGLCFYRTLIDANVPSNNKETAFVYNNGLLIAEYDRTGNGNDLQARYYYADTDVPIAADIRDGTGELQRYYYLQDVAGSVMGLTDAAGNLVERYSYDAWGQPVIELPDYFPPVVSRVVTAADGLLIEFSERVLPPLVGGESGGFVTALQELSASISVSCEGDSVGGVVRYEENLPGFEFGGVLRFQAGSPLSGSCELNLAAGSVVDEWNNPNAQSSLAFTFDSTVGAVLLQESDLSTVSQTIARSSVGSPFLFHGQYFDYDAGLVYMRARFYNPSTGLFLQPDPDGYEDSVNLYAAFGNNPVNFRDPTGRSRYSVPGTRITISGRVGLVSTRPRVSPTATTVVRPRARLGNPANSSVDATTPSTARVKNIAKRDLDDGNHGVFRSRQPGDPAPRQKTPSDANMASNKGEESLVDSMKPYLQGQRRPPSQQDEIRERVLKNVGDSAEARLSSRFETFDNRPPATQKNYEVYTAPSGEKRIQFKADAAVTGNEANPGRNYTADASAALDKQGRVFVLEGRHRAIGAARGDEIPEELGGVPGKRGWLDYPFDDEVKDYSSIPVKNLEIDYTKPEARTVRESDDLWEQEINNIDFSNLTNP